MNNKLINCRKLEFITKEEEDVPGFTFWLGSELNELQ